MSSLIRQAAKNDNISTIFVVSSQQKFYGAIDLKDLIIARQDHPLEELVVTSYPYVYAEEEIDECIERLKDYSEDSVPVLDNDNRLLGVITSSSIIELVDDEMGEDYAKLAGLTAEEDLKEPLKESMKKENAVAVDPACSRHGCFVGCRHVRDSCDAAADHHVLPVPDSGYGR